MIRNYLKVAYRNLLKNKAFTLVNVFGLAIGMAACFFIFLFVRFELSYDRFHKNAAQLYRVPVMFTGSLGTIMRATNHPAVGPALKANFPQVQDFARIAPLSVFLNASMISVDGSGDKSRTFNEDKIYFADPSFLTMFSFPFQSGNPQTALSDPNSIVISASEAKKYFGNENPMGRTLTLNRQLPFKVTGVFKDIPENAHLKFDMLLPLKKLESLYPGMPGAITGLDEIWIWPEFYTYVLLSPGTNPKNLEAKFPALINHYLGDKMKQYKYRNDFYLQPITAIHLTSNYEKEAEANGSARELYFLSIIGIFILIVAWINYINLSTAKSVERAREVGLRKVVGAAKGQLIAQFIMDAVLINLLASVLATGIVLGSYPFFSRLTGKNIGSGFASSGLLQQPLFWLCILGVFLLGSFLVGAYPALVLSGFKPVQVLKGRFSHSSKGIVLRTVLVSFQFVLSILLIAGTFTIFSQLAYMRGQDPGYNRDQILVLKAPAIYDSTITSRIATFKDHLLNDPSVADVCVSDEIPARALQNVNSVRKMGEDKTHNFTPFLIAADERFINTYQIKMAAGRSFLPEDTCAMNGQLACRVIVNQAVVKGIGYKSAKDAIGQRIVLTYGEGSLPAEIIGVVQDYHQRSLKDAYDPILYFYPKFSSWSYISVRLNARNASKDIASFEKAYKDIFPGNAFEYFFLDDYFNRQYLADQRFGQVFGLFAGLAIFVACLGLLGLSSFIVHLRTKEIGIRKVLGASLPSLLILLSKDFVKVVCIASCIALPIIYYAAGRWLEHYAFHIRLNWVIFVVPPVLLLAISLLTISLHSVKAVLANPVESLKVE